MLEALFGSETAEKILLYLENYEQGYAREIARTFSLSFPNVNRKLRQFEHAGILVSQEQGRTRVYRWNPRFAFLNQLRALLQSMIRSFPEAEIKKYYRKRMRPRRAGKPL